MLREGAIEDIFDGKYYSPEDLVPVGCRDCEGCSDCCRNTGDTIILDPYDMYLLCAGTGKSFQDMIEKEIEIRLVDGIILPNLMQHHDRKEKTADRSGRPSAEGDIRSEEKDLEKEQETPLKTEDRTEDCCPFLSDAGRCTIHSFRPGLCRLYPMGRYYTEEGFRYILQKDECTDRPKTPVLLRDWLGIEDLPRYEAFVLVWHDFKKELQRPVPALTQRSRDSVLRYVLQIFFVHPYLTKQDFYPQFKVRMETCREALREIL